MSTFDYINKCTNLVRQREDFSSGGSGGLPLGRWLLASLFALFAGISRWLQPSVPMRTNASVWRSVVFTTFIIGMIAMGRVAWADISFVDSGQSLSNFASNDVALGDLDGDGDLDAFVTNYFNQADIVWLNDGKGNFTDSGQRLDPANSYSNSVILVDLDNDNDLDAFVLHNGGRPSKIWWNDGKGFFTDSGQNLKNSDAWGIDLGDLDGDGDLDAYIANAWNIPDRVWFNDGSGYFSDSGQSIGNTHSHRIALGDVDDDGDLDVFVPNSSSQGDKVWLNDGMGHFHDSSQSLGLASATTARLADLDGDNDIDVFVNNNARSQVGEANAVWLNDGTGKFVSNGQALGHLSSYDIDLVDIDNDGDIDAIVTNQFQQPNEIWLNDGHANFTDSGLKLGNSISLGIAMGDLDNDGDLDAFVANDGANKVWLNQSNPPAACTRWNLIQDFLTSPNEENPNPDSCGNPNVWHFMEGSVNTLHDATTYVPMAKFLTDTMTQLYGIPDGQQPEYWAGSYNYGSGVFMPYVGINRQTSEIMNVKPNTTHLHPSPNEAAIVGWRSPVDGMVKVTGSVANIDSGNVRWFLDKGNSTLASGVVANKTGQSFDDIADLDDIAVKKGDFLYFIIEPNGQFYFDSSSLDVSIELVESNIKILITSVKYGEQDANGKEHYCDATVQFKQECDDNQSCSVYVGNQLCGDPLVGTVKKAEIAYSCNGKMFNITVPEYDTAFLSCDSSSSNVCPNSTCNVAKNGSDETGNGSEAKPFATIQHGIDTAEEGYTVLVHPGTYVENINFNGKNITLKSTDGAEKTVIDGNNKDTVLLFRNGEKTTVDGFTLTRGYGVGTSGRSGGINASGNSSPTLKNLVITNNVSHDGGGIHCNTATPTLINVEITKNISNVGAGIYIDNCNYTLRNVTVADNHAKYSNMGGGIFSHSSGKLNAINSIFWNNTPNNIRTSGTPAINFSYSNIEGGWEGEGNLEAEPLFENGYQLSDESLLLGMGTTENAPTTDLLGNLRPNPEGSNPDIGAYENVLNIAVTCPTTPTIESANNGNWADAATWTANRVPNENDIVMINANHSVTTHEPPSMVKGFCNFGMLTNEPNSKLIINAIDFFYNKGKIHSANGLGGSCPEGKNDASKYIHASAGSNIIIWTDEFVNKGEILAGIGGDDSTWQCLDDSDPGKWAYWVAPGRLHRSNYGTWSYQYQNGEIQFGFPSIGGAGGQVEIYPATFENTGKIEGGKGGAGNSNGNDNTTDDDDEGDGWVHGTSIGGLGGKVLVNPTDIANSSNAGILKGGCGGHADIPGCWKTGDIACNANNVNPSRAGNGGDVIFNVANLSGAIQGCTGSRSYWDPVTLTATANARMEGFDHIEIFGREDWKLDLAELPEGAISATETITIALGKGSTVDLRGINTKVFSAGQKVEIFADNILLDDGVTLQDVIDAPEVTTAPAKVIRRISLSTEQQIIAEPNTIVPIALTVLNGGTASDTYSLNITDEAGWSIHTQTTQLTLDSQESQQVIINVNLPELQGQSNIVTITASSQAEPEVTKTVAVRLATEGSYVAPQSKYTASGTLNDANGQPIAGATVQVGDLITTTDENGQWTLNGLTEAQHQLIISKAGYSFKPVTFVTSANTPATTVNVPAPQSALSVEIGRVPSLVEQGEPLLSYSTTVSNKGLETATNVTLQQSLSTGHENVVIDSSGSCNFDGATIQCQLVDIPANNSIVIDTHSTPNRDVQSLSTSAVVSSNYPESSDTLITKIYPHFRVNSWISPSETMLDAHAVLNLRITNGQYSPAIANDVTAVINLPNGVEFVSAELENGNCLHESNIVSCTLNPMPADTTESIKVTVKATHTGTQQIIVEADASNFDIVTTTGKVMVNSPESELDKADVVFLIDTTGSMANDIQAVINALVQLVNELDEQKAPKVGIILFKDEITDSIVTDDLNAIIDLLQNIKVSGGDEIYFCPENAVSAMNKAVNLINDNGRIILATDASYHPDTSSADAEDIMQDKNVAFDVLLSGDCVNSRNTRRDNTSCDLSATGEILSAETVYHCLADATGGTFTYIEDIKSGSTEAMNQYVDQLLSLLQVVVQQVNIDDEPEEDVKGDGKGSDDGNKENITLVDPETKTYLAPPQADSFWVFVGSPNGHVVSKPAGIDCNKGYGQCFYYFKRGTKLELIPTAPEGLYFDSWYGDVGCEDGKFTVTGMKACSAIFYGIPKP